MHKNTTSDSWDDDVVDGRRGASSPKGLRKIRCEDTMSSTKTYAFDSWEDPELNLKEKLLRGIYAMGFENPSAIQKRACYPMIYGRPMPVGKDSESGKVEIRDITAQAQSGTGKTGTFCVGTLQIIDETLNTCQAMIMAPTRELAEQICGVIKDLGVKMNIRVKLLIGGTRVDDDRVEIIEQKPQIVVGTPGRILDILKRRYLSPEHIKLMVLDEADEMLSVGFKDQIYDVFQFLRNEVQIGLFSATFSPELKQLTEKFMRNPIEILVKSGMLTLQGISQWFVKVDNDKSKYSIMLDIFQNLTINQSIIYCNSIPRVDDLWSAMENDGFPVGKIHGGMTGSERKQAHEDFKRGACRVLISTNMFARGIDVQQVSVVVNFDVPKDRHTYLHRIGRSGRWGRKGTAINFATKQDIVRIGQFERYYDTEIREMPSNYADLMRKGV